MDDKVSIDRSKNEWVDERVIDQWIGQVDEWFDRLVNGEGDKSAIGRWMGRWASDVSMDRAMDGSMDRSMGERWPAGYIDGRTMARWLDQWISKSQSVNRWVSG